jgi:nicotinamide riboside kinase
VDERQTPLGTGDVEPIARGQIESEDAAIARAGQVVVLDTDVVSTVVYSRHYYGACPPWVEQAARARLGGLYLLLFPDVPWMADGLQRDRPHQRDQVHEEFRQALDAWQAPVVHVRGSDWDSRRATARAALLAALQAAGLELPRA